MVAVVRIANHELLDRRKLTFDRVEPRRVGWRPDQMNIVLKTPTSDFGSPVRREVVQDQVNALPDGILSARTLQNLQHFARSLSAARVAPQLVAMNVVERQPVTHPVLAGVGGGEAIRAARGAPTSTVLWTNLQGAELVEGNRRAIGCRPIHVASDQFF